MKLIKPEELLEKMDRQPEMLLLDVRAADKYEDFHIEGDKLAELNIPKTEIFKLENEEEYELSALPTDREIVVTCTTGNSAAKCARILSDRAYDVQVLEGGITAWKEYISKRSIQNMWEEYTALHSDAPDHYEAWAFGDSKEMADELAELVLEGQKTATASNYMLYELENEPLPEAGLHNIILDGNGEAVAVAVTTEVKVVPFHEVPEEHAYAEGEGDRSLSFWREVHESFFTKELEEAGLEFNERIPVVCETFVVRYKK